MIEKRYRYSVHSLSFQLDSFHDHHTLQKKTRDGDKQVKSSIKSHERCFSAAKHPWIKTNRYTRAYDRGIYAYDIKCVHGKRHQHNDEFQIHERGQ